MQHSALPIHERHSHLMLSNNCGSLQLTNPAPYQPHEFGTARRPKMLIIRLILAAARGDAEEIRLRVAEQSQIGLLGQVLGVLAVG